MTDASSEKTDVSCCGPSPAAIMTPDYPTTAHWIDGTVSTPAGEFPRVSTKLIFKDRLGSWRVRWGIGRMSYRVAPGLYAVGSPTSESPVMVSANYKMSFDRLRSHLTGRDAWILVLDTRGVNVWCAAGKGTFGTEELVRRLNLVRLPEVVTHRRLVLPQLSATGVCAHEVKKLCGFRVIFGPVRASDLPAFLDARMKATPAMRRVEFPLGARIVLVPVDLTSSARYALPIATGLLLLSALGSDGFVLSRVASDGVANALVFIIAWVAGIAMTPIFLPWLPGRPFSIKGAWAGVLFFAVLAISGLCDSVLSAGWVPAAAWFFIITVASSFLGMTFTGSSTYTSLSGVRKEMRLAVPLQIAAAVVGFGLWLAGRFVKG